MAVPVMLGRYRVLDVLGTGGFATVYRAVDDRLDTEVALKVLAENHSLVPEFRERFITEGHVLRRIDSPHVITVFDLGETDRQQPFLVLELADRGDFARRARERRSTGRLPVLDDARQALLTLSEALTAVHAAGVVHRDLAPRNLLLRSCPARPGAAPSGTLIDPGERIMLADLGFCKDLTLGSGLTVGGGTEGFRPPEQRIAPARVDPRSDLWAASALMVWLLTGVAPESATDWRRRLDEAGFGALTEPLARGLAAAPPDRHPDVASWFADLAGAIGPSPGSGPVTDSAIDAITSPNAGPDRRTVVLTGQEPRPAPAAPAPAARRRWPVVAGTALLATTIGAAGGAIVVTTMDDSGVRVEQLERGRVRVADRASGLAIVGPATVPAGQTATFTAEGEADNELVWIGPDGGIHPSVQALEVATQSEGLATVRLLGVGSDGSTTETSLSFQVVAP